MLVFACKRTHPIFSLLAVFSLIIAVCGVNFVSVEVVHASGNTWTVNSLGDSGTNTCQMNTGSAGPACQLRDALNQVTNGDTIVFSVTGTLTLNTSSYGSMVVLHNITVQGPGPASLSVSGNNASRIFDVNSGTVVTISGLTLTEGNAPQNPGGALASNSATVTISNCVFSANVNGGGTDGGGGGAIYNTGTMTINQSTFVNNSAANFAGAIRNDGVLTITNSTFSGNSANGGGAIGNLGISIVISNSTIAGNSATSGGAIYNQIGNLTIGNSTISANSASDGGGIYSYGFHQPTLTFASDILAGNSAPVFPDLENYVVSGHAATFNTLGYNVIGNPGSVTFNGTGDQIGANPVLGALASNGGPTQTMAPAAGSAAIRHGFCAWSNTGIPPPPPAVTTDQRGQNRKSVCDAGAYETPPPLPVVDSIGIYRGVTFYLRLHNTQGFADTTVAFSAGSSPYPVSGDWTGAGYDTVGVYDRANGNFYLRNSNTTGYADEHFTLGNPSDMPLSGQWAITATHDGAGVYRSANGVLYLKNTLVTGFADHAMVMGLPGDEGVAGDWTSKGYDSPGIYRPNTIGFYLSNKVTNGPVYADISLTYGSSTDLPIAGDWIAQGHDGIGMFRPGNGFVYLKNALTTGFADNSFFYGIAGDIPVAGHWQLTYPPAAPFSKPALSVLVPKPPLPQSSSGSVPDSSRIGD